MSVASLTDLRSTLADLLVSSGGPPVIPYGADAVAPPALLVRWADPWLEQDGDGQCRYTGRLEVWIVTSRTEPASGTPELETLVSGVLRALAGDPYPWSISVGVPGNIEVAGITYFGCRALVTAPTIPNEGS